MSSPTPTPQPHDAQTTAGQKKPENGVEERVEGAEEQPIPMEKPSQQGKADTGANATDTAGQAAAPPGETSLKDTEGDGGNTEARDDVEGSSAGHDKAEPISTTTENGPSSELSTMESTTATTAPPAALASTPPRETSSKAAGKAAVRSPSPPPLPPKDDRYLSSSNGVPSRSTSPASQGRSSGRNSEDNAAAEYDAKYDGAGDAGDEQSEIQSIMEQFDHGDRGPEAADIMSPRMELAGPLLDSPTAHPPRRSSLVPVDKPLPIPNEAARPDTALQSPPPRTSSLYRTGTNNSLGSLTEPRSPSAHAPQYKPTPPVPHPDPEPDLPFDFHRFLDQLRHKSADPVAKFLRSFLFEFNKKQWMVHEQVKIIGDFLDFIWGKMAQCDVWATVSDAEFDNAREGMEKLVMNRLYNYCFSPAIPPPAPVHPSRRKQRNEEPPPGRRGQHQEDVERDEVLAQKVRIYKWVREEHLDIQPVGEKGRKFLRLAQDELIKIKSYRAPRDKVICILNCCKVIFGFLRTSQSDQSADAFVPLLIYTVLQANPDHLVSNVQYILRFRNQDKLGGEAGYYISSLMGAIQFIEGLDRTSLTVSDEEFEKNVEAAVSAIAEKHSQTQPQPATPESSTTPVGRAEPKDTLTPSDNRRRMPSPRPGFSEKSTISRPEVTPRNSLDAERAGPLRASSFRNNKSESSEQPEEEIAAVTGLLRTIQKPLSSIGRIFSDNDATAATSSARSSPQQLPRRSTDYPGMSEKAHQSRRSAEEQQRRERFSAEDAAARQASAEAEEARKIQRQEHRVVVETLQGMFPDLDKEVIDDVVRMKEGRVGLAVDACLALSNP